MSQRREISQGIRMKARVAFLVASAGLAAHAVASEPLSFTDEAVARGVEFKLGFNYAQFGSGLMLLDLNNDSHLDIVIAGGQNDGISVYENDGTGHFIDRTAVANFGNNSTSSGLSAADYDNDGDLDFFVSGWVSSSRLYRNDGNFHFTDVALEAGVKTNCPLMSTTWGDIDGDGFLDLYASVRTLTFADETKNFMFHNNGDGTFTDRAAALGVDAELDPTLLAAFFDYDRDGDDDLYLGTDKGTHNGISNRLYRNDKNAGFTEVTDKTNSAANIDCMGIAVGDLDYDGLFDMYLTNIQVGNKLLMNDGKGVFVDQTKAAGMGNYAIGWGTVFADFDNDTNLDTYVCNMLGENKLYRGSQTWPMIDEGATAGVNVPEDVFCVAVGDVDGDHDLDMLVGTSNDGVHLFINHSVDAATNNYVRFNVVGEVDKNVFGVGTSVEVDTGDMTQLREVRSGVNYKAQDEYTLHYGLGDAGTIEEVRAIFPGGLTRTFTDVPVNGEWTLYRQDRVGDVDGNGCVDLSEFSMAIQAISKPGVSLSAGNEIFDANGDFVIDSTDIMALLSKICAQKYSGPVFQSP